LWFLLFPPLGFVGVFGPSSLGGLQKEGKNQMRREIMTWLKLRDPKMAAQEYTYANILWFNLECLRASSQ